MKIRDLITEDKWTKNAFARDAQGKGTGIIDPKACKFCLSGWIMKVYEVQSPLESPVYEKCCSKLKLEVGLSIWNDTPERTFAEVKQLVEELDI